MRRLIDTAVLVDHLRGDPRAKDLLIGFARGGDELWSVVLVRTEILAGMRRGEERTTHRLLNGFKWQDITLDIADRAGDLARQYTKSHSGVDTVDYVLASAALVLGAELVTLNVKHFPMFPALRPAYR